MKTQVKKVAVKQIGIAALVVLSSFAGNDSITENYWKTISGIWKQMQIPQKFIYETKWCTYQRIYNFAS